MAWETVRVNRMIRSGAPIFFAQHAVLLGEYLGRVAMVAADGLVLTDHALVSADDDNAHGRYLTKISLN